MHCECEAGYDLHVGSILLVEADPAICDTWTSALSAAGHAVLAVSAGRDALPMIKDGGIDVVIIDAYDPRGGIVELARTIEAITDAPPLILVSDSPHAPEISARIGAVAFLPAPCDIDDLLATVARVAGNVRPVRMVEDEPTAPLSFSSVLIKDDPLPHGA